MKGRHTILRQGLSVLAVAGAIGAVMYARWSGWGYTNRMDRPAPWELRTRPVSVAPTPSARDTDLVVMRSRTQRWGVRWGRWIDVTQTEWEQAKASGEQILKPGLYFDVHGRKDLVLAFAGEVSRALSGLRMEEMESYYGWPVDSTVDDPITLAAKHFMLSPDRASAAAGGNGPRMWVRLVVIARQGFLHVQTVVHAGKGEDAGWRFERDEDLGAEVGKILLADSGEREHVPVKVTNVLWGAGTQSIPYDMDSRPIEEQQWLSTPAGVFRVYRPGSDAFAPVLGRVQIVDLLSTMSGRRTRGRRWMLVSRLVVDRVMWSGPKGATFLPSPPVPER